MPVSGRYRKQLKQSMNTAGPILTQMIGILQYYSVLKNPRLMKNLSPLSYCAVDTGLELVRPYSKLASDPYETKHAF